MKSLRELCPTFFGQRDLGQNDEPPDVSPATAPAFFACLASMVFLYSAARPAVSLLRLWWAELLAYTLLPMAVAFVILYRGRWHREMSKTGRTLFLILQSGLIFVAALFFASILVISFYIFVYRFRSFHA